MWIMVTLFVAAIGGILFLKLKVPGGMIVGAVLAVVILNIGTGKAYLYSEARVLAQSLAGAYIGCLMTREKMRSIPRVIRPCLLVVSSLLVLNLCTGIILYWITDLDLLTCLLSAAPGGVTDIPLVAMDMGANASVVAVMQFVRMLFGIGCLPSLIKISDRLIEPDVARATEEQAMQRHQNAGKKQNATLRGFLPAFVLALAASIVGKWSGIPAGAISAALVVTAILNISGKCHGMPMWLRRGAQVVSGCCIGCTVTREQISKMSQLLVPAIILCLGYVFCCIAMGLVMSKLLHMDLRESMLSFSPAGLSEMVFIAADLGVNSTNLVVLQLGRFASTLLIFPHIYSLIAQFIL